MIDPEGFAFARWVWVRRHGAVTIMFRRDPVESRYTNENLLKDWRLGNRGGYQSHDPGVA